MQQNPMHPLDTRVDGLYRIVKGRISWDNLIPTCLEVAQELEQMDDIKGPERLDLLQKTLRFAVGDSDMEADKKEKVLFFINSVLPIAMQAAILASKSPVLRQVQATCCGCWTSSKK